MRNEHDRVRRHTAKAVLSCIDDETRASLARDATADRDQTDARLRELEREWDSDRVIEAEGALTALTGLALTLIVNRRFAVIPAMAAIAICTHAASGWYPLLPLFRRLGVRSAREIARERYAIKLLRGDFDTLEAAAPSTASSRAATPAGNDSQIAREDRVEQRATPDLH